MSCDSTLNNNTRLTEVTKLEVLFHCLVILCGSRGALGHVSQATLQVLGTRLEQAGATLTCESLRLSFTCPQCHMSTASILGDQGRNTQKTAVNISESVTSNPNLPLFQSQVSSKIVPVVILEHAGLSRHQGSHH